MRKLILIGILLLSVLPRTSNAQIIVNTSSPGGSNPSGDTFTWTKGKLGVYPATSEGTIWVLNSSQSAFDANTYTITTGPGNGGTTYFNTPGRFSFYNANTTELATLAIAEFNVNGQQTNTRPDIGTNTVNNSSYNGLVQYNSTAATGGATIQHSPNTIWTGYAWDANDSVSREMTVLVQDRPISGNEPDTRLYYSRVGGGLAQRVDMIVGGFDATSDHNTAVWLGNVSPSSSNYFAYTTGTSTTVLLGSSGVSHSATSGVETILGLSGQAENLLWDYAGTANTVVVTTGTGVTKVDYGNIVTEGKFNASDGSAGITQTCATPVTAATVVDGLITSITCP